MRADAVTTIRPLSVGMRGMLLVASGLVFIVGIQLFILTTATDRFFAWTVEPPLTAAFMGGAYWSSCLLEFLAAREQTWARSRVAVPAVLLFTTFTLIATLIHLDRFHLDASSMPFYTVGLTWVWIAVYAIVPLTMSALLALQLRVPGADPPREQRLPRWMHVLLIIQAAVMLLPGAVLFVVPHIIIGAWPWLLTELTGRVIGAWLIGLGIAAAHTSWENDFNRVYPVMFSMVAFALFQVVALARYPADMHWNSPQGWFYLIFLVSIVIVGGVGVWKGRQLDDGTS